MDTLRSIEFTDALLHLHGLIGLQVKLSANIYGRFIGWGVSGRLSRVDTLPPDHSSIILVLDGRQTFFVDPIEVEPFGGRDEDGRQWLEFRIAPDASVVVERGEAASEPGEAI